MATAGSIINDALKEISVLAEDETPSATMSNDALRSLNRLMELWSNSAAFAYVATILSRALTGESSFTIGLTGQLVSARPIAISTATVDRDGITYPVRVIDQQLWENISYKAADGANTSLVYYEADLPNGTVNVWPVASGCTLNLSVLTVVTSFADLVTDVSLPPGYEEAFISNLAVNLAPSYGVMPSQLTLQSAKSSLKTIKKTNRIIPTMTIDPALTNYGRGGSLAAFMGGT